MTVFMLGPEPCFPDPSLAEPDGLLAVGGDLSLERLLTAYAHGIFPWYNFDTPILWWSPDPRPIIIPEKLRISRSLRRVLRKGVFEVTFDRSFEEVISRCASTPRPVGDGTWLVWEMIEAYVELHEQGFAHSVEAWKGGKLTGGLYGVSLGKAFFGESMFFREPNASKVAFVHLVRQLHDWGFHFIDCQQTTDHMLVFGAQEISRDEFRLRLREALRHPTRRGKWILGDPGCGEMLAPE